MDISISQAEATNIALSLTVAINYIDEAILQEKKKRESQTRFISIKSLQKTRRDLILAQSFFNGDVTLRFKPATPSDTIPQMDPEFNHFPENQA